MAHLGFNPSETGGHYLVWYSPSNTHIYTLFLYLGKENWENRNNKKKIQKSIVEVKSQASIEPTVTDGGIKLKKKFNFPGFELEP